MTCLSPVQCLGLLLTYTTVFAVPAPAGTPAKAKDAQKSDYYDYNDEFEADYADNASHDDGDYLDDYEPGMAKDGQKFDYNDYDSADNASHDAGADLDDYEPGVWCKSVCHGEHAPWSTKCAWSNCRDCDRCANTSVGACQSWCEKTKGCQRVEWSKSGGCMMGGGHGAAIVAGCQCADHTRSTDKGGGSECTTIDSSGKAWCYTRPGVCQDGGLSSVELGFDFSFAACAPLRKVPGDGSHKHKRRKKHPTRKKDPKPTKPGEKQHR